MFFDNQSLMTLIPTGLKVLSKNPGHSLGSLLSVTPDMEPAGRLAALVPRSQSRPTRLLRPRQMTIGAPGRVEVQRIQPGLPVAPVAVGERSAPRSLSPRRPCDGVVASWCFERK